MPDWWSRCARPISVRTAAGVLAGVQFQRAIEEAAFELGGGAFRAPGQRLRDFLNDRISDDLPATSYHPGVAPAAIDRMFPPAIAQALRAGLGELARKIPGFLHPDAVLVGAETRTSAPIRVLRDPVTLAAPGFPGLYPVGEGAGYAGGIVSAALDGARAAAAILAAGQV